MGIDRCICHKITFSEIKEIAIDQGLTSVEEVIEEKIACTNCKLCYPYIELIFETGETEFSRKVFRMKK